MALDRVDFRGKLDADLHAAMKAIAEADGMGDGEWIESVIVPVIKRRVHAAMFIAGRVERKGNFRELSGTPGTSNGEA